MTLLAAQRARLHRHLHMLAGELAHPLTHAVAIAAHPTAGSCHLLDGSVAFVRQAA